jgi:CRP-like cAMP-binding protein
LESESRNAIVKEGEVPRATIDGTVKPCVFFLLEGRVQVYRSHFGARLHLGARDAAKAKSIFGEFELASSSATAEATVRSSSKVRLAAVDSVAFLRVVRADTKALERLWRLTAEYAIGSHNRAISLIRVPTSLLILDFIRNEFKSELSKIRTGFNIGSEWVGVATSYEEISSKLPIQITRQSVYKECRKLVEHEIGALSIIDSKLHVRLDKLLELKDCLERGWRKSIQKRSDRRPT